jgi:hypothetical protein
VPANLPSRRACGEDVPALRRAGRPQSDSLTPPKISAMSEHSGVHMG